MVCAGQSADCQDKRFAHNIHVSNEWGKRIAKLVSQELQPCAFRAFCDSAREVDCSKFHLHIMLELQVIARNCNKSQLNVCVI